MKIESSKAYKPVKQATAHEGERLRQKTRAIGMLAGRFSTELENTHLYPSVLSLP